MSQTQVQDMTSSLLSGADALGWGGLEYEPIPTL